MTSEQQLEIRRTDEVMRGRTANRRDVLKAASGLVAAAAIGGVMLQSGTESALAAGESFQVEIDELGAVFPAQSFQFGVGRGISSPVGDGRDRDASAPSLSEITLTKVWDRYSALLQFEAIAGDALPTVRLIFTDGGKIELGRIVLHDVLLSGSSWSYGGGDPRLNGSESLSLNFAKIEVTFQGGSYRWDLTTNRSF